MMLSIGRITHEIDLAWWYVKRPFWVALGWTRWNLFPGSLSTCQQCGKLAQWSYCSPQWYLCDHCVPRGCDCNVIGDVEGKVIFDPPDENGIELVWVDYGGIEPEQRRDKRGRLLPCVDYAYSRWGWPKSDSSA